MPITAPAQSSFLKIGQGHHERLRAEVAGGEKDTAMRNDTTSRSTSNRAQLAFVGAKSMTSESGSPHLPTPVIKHGNLVRNRLNSPSARSEAVELLADIDGVLVLVRFLVTDIPEGARSDLLRKDADLHSLLSSTLERVADRLHGSPLRTDLPSKQPLATVELISSGEQLIRLPDLSNETVLRVGPLELDLLDRFAKRGDRKIDLRPREFQLLKYMMQHSDKLLTRATLLKEVWHYTFVPKTNLVDVHMGKLRRKVDGPNESPMIRNVRGLGFALSATAISYCPTPRPSGRTEVWTPDNSARQVERALQS
jgi:DNA-binding response OmpR family regulator